MTDKLFRAFHISRESKTLLTTLFFRVVCALIMIDPTSNDLQKYLDLVATRQKLVISNIANADTPGYQTQDIDFENEFKNLAVGETPDVISVSGLPIKNDGNDVSIDRESRLLSENALRFRMATSLLKDRFSMIKQALQADKS